VGGLAERDAQIATVDRRTLGVWAGVMLVLGAAFVRAMCSYDPFPWWEADPFRFAPPISGLTPTSGLAMDGLVLLGAGLVLGCSRRGPGRIAACLIAIGLGVISFHAATNMETVTDGASIAASVAAMAAVWAASSVPGVRRVVLGAALGFGVMLAAGGAQEVLIEHPRTVESFQQTRESFYQAKGWDPAGPEAAMYEERLSHPNPTGPFGLTNVLATFAGASAVGLLGVALSGGWNRSSRLAMIAGAAASGWALLATGSKGGVGAAALAGLVVAVSANLRPAWIGRAALAASIGVVLAVFARGLLGDGVGELSLLFRSQYQIGTVSIWAEHPIVGTGPGLFQDAYTRLKPAGAPEDVTSAHSVFFDWVGVLGVGGLGFVAALILGWTRRSEPGSEERPTMSRRTLGRLVGGVVAAAVVAAALTQRETMGLEGALALLAGAVGWGTVGIWIAAGTGRVGNAALAASAVALIHGQLDVTAVWSVSAPLWGVLIGLGVGCLRTEPTGRSRWMVIGTLGCVLSVLVWRGSALMRWERGLNDAADWASRIAAVRLEAVFEGEPGLARAAETLGEWLGTGVPARPDAVEAALEEASLIAHDDAADGLREALRARPTHSGTRAALGRVLAAMAMRDQTRAPQKSARFWDEVVASAEAGTDQAPWDAGTWSWLGRAYELRSRAAVDPAAWLGRAAEAWTEADRLTPQDPGSAARLAGVLWELGREAEARDWAGEALQRDDALVLDPRRRLSARDRASMERLARGIP